MTKAEIARKFDEIVAFAEIEQFIDTPVKRYSSGMYVRLAFAVAAHLESEILLVDEVLAVGDAEFQKKCLGKMGDVALKEGRTVLFVSHNMAAIRQLCPKGIILSNGNLSFIGEISHCIDSYINENTDVKKSIVDHITFSDKAINVTSISINGSPNDELNISSDILRLEVVVTGKLSRSLRIDLECRITDIYGVTLAIFSPGHMRGEAKLHPAGVFTLKRVIILPKGINRGEYYLNMSITNPNYTGWVNIDRAVRIISEGYATKTGRAIEYTSGAGWLFLESEDE